MTQAVQIVEELDRLYTASVTRLKEALTAYLQDGTTPSLDARAQGCFAYPEIRLVYRGEGGRPTPMRSFGRLVSAGDYRISVTKPALFKDYLVEQLTLLMEDYDVSVEAVPGRQEIPFPYVLDPGHALSLDQVSAAELARFFPATELAHIGDEIADGLWMTADGNRPLALFDGLRTDFSLARLRHYTGTPPEHCQRYVLFTNYHRYVDEFVRWGASQLGEGSRFTALSGAGGIVIERPEDVDKIVTDSAWRRHQMPAYHLVAKDGTGITLVNIGVGPSNAKTICDHLAVMRPEAWLMIGHCGGLRPSQRIGDYVLAHAYLRDDHVLDDVLPPEIPVPAIAEVQVALAKAAEIVSGQSGDELKRRLRTGTIVTTDDRNWELRYSKSALRFSLSRAVGIDMESATIAAQGYRFRVPYGTLLCVSDKPLHGELKLPGQANRFYERAISEHMRIGIETCEQLRREGDKLHSRKLRAFNEPPFR
ncbi:AMP nucleosidase [Sphingomonas sp. S17]|uniref:AMP nucleosidase n=2 Tax=Sphingomonas paucimobilis TaxID=13689 RepID=A0A411LGT9_SPHPI|nr:MULTISPECIES: AMP nucleosidase [Sphingomonas]EGI56289.1 AMP nucleosidase [Sphingomonas sp. S17]MBQ1481410.1 AMP nucleosidase [Sphingomonas sp.]MCM3677642.1 AMP nucleosidase [Sphingomonas paucimobilis]MDG5972269.1 AMP nucleosidase [Sphingomonas paucimobilis]NNG57752.1 AMP nucleosidase [Sphingomonas paucimobilis]